MSLDGTIQFLCQQERDNMIPLMEHAKTETLPEKVFVYRNLKHKDKVVYSVKDTKTGKVVAHVENISLENVSFVVRQAGRERVLRDKQKNVHAGLRGTPVNKDSSGVAITYNPYKNSSFVERETGNSIFFSEEASLGPRGGFANNIIQTEGKTR